MSLAEQIVAQTLGNILANATRPQHDLVTALTSGTPEQNCVRLLHKSMAQAVNHGFQTAGGVDALWAPFKALFD